MTQRLLEPGQVQQALREIAEAREHLRLASDVLSAFGTTDTVGEELAAVAEEGRQLEPLGSRLRIFSTSRMS